MENGTPEQQKVQLTPHERLLQMKAGALALRTFPRSTLIEKARRHGAHSVADSFQESHDEAITEALEDINPHDRQFFQTMYEQKIAEMTEKRQESAAPQEPQA